MARIRMAYLGGGSTRAAGTMASFLWQAADFAGSEVCLIDLDADRLELIAKLARRMAKAQGADVEITTTTDREAGLADADAVLSSFRPGGFAARVKDERIPISHGLIGQETQGAGGFFMALRAVAVLREVAEELERVAPRAKVFNYTNPVNIVAQAWTTHSEIPLVSLCEGPIIFPRNLARDIGLDETLADARMIGLNHACWAVEQTYDGKDYLPVLADRYEELRARPDPAVKADAMQQLEIAVRMGHVGAQYFKYYYFEDDIVREMQAKPTTRAEDILTWAPGYWAHYEEQAEREEPVLDPQRSRGGIHELELAIDVMDAVFNDKDEVHPVNIPNRGGALPGFPEDLVVEIYGRTTGGWIEPLQQPALPAEVRGLVQELAAYQQLAAEAAWTGDRDDAIRALVANPLVRTLPNAETLYDELSAAHAAYLPERLLR